MNVMQRYTWETLRRNRKRTIVTIVGVMISAAMITAVAVLSLSFLDMLQCATIIDGGNWHVSTAAVPAANLPLLENNPSVDRLTVSRDAGYALLQGSQNPGKRYLFVRELGSGGAEQMAVRLKSGRLPQNAGELAVSETVLNTAGVSIAVGDTLTLELGRRLGADGSDIQPGSPLQYQTDEKTGEDAIDPKTGDRILAETLAPQGTRTYTIVGIIERPYFETSWAAACGAVTCLDTATLGAGAVDVAYTARPIDRGLYARAQELAKAVGATGDTTFNDTLLRYYGVVKGDTLYSFLVWFVSILGVIIVAASVSTIYNAFAISVSERSRQLGLLASVGATRQQKRASVYFEAALIGTAGIPLGILAGIGGVAATLALIQPLLGSFINATGGVAMRLVVSPVAIAVAIVLSAVTIFLSAYKPARQASRVTPIDAIRQAQDVRIAGKSVRTSRLTRRLFGFEGEVALKNLKRSRRRYRATIVSLAISIVLFLTVSTYTGMMRLMGGATSEGLNYDIAVTYTNLSAAQIESSNSAIAALEPVKAATASTTAWAWLDAGNNLSALARQYNTSVLADPQRLNANIVFLDDAAYRDYAGAVGVDASGQAGQPLRAILINAAQGWYKHDKEPNRKLVGAVLNVNAGDQLQLKPQSEGGQTVPVQLAAVTDQRPMGVLIMDFSNITLVMPASSFDTMAAQFGASFAAGARRQLFLSTSDDQSLERQVAGITATLPPASFSVFNVQSAVRNANNLQTVLGVFIYGFIVLISMICIANIFNTVSTNIALRRKEFAMLRSVGMTPKGFARMMRYESIFYGLKGLLYGLPLSFLIAVGLNRLQGTVLGAGFVLPWKSYIVAVGMIFVIVSVTMLYSTRRIKQENILDALREENL